MGSRRRFTSSRAGKSRLAAIGISLVSGLALVGGFTIATAVGAAPAGATGTAVSLKPTAPKPVLQKGQPLSTRTSTHAGQVAPAVSSTPHLIPHTSINQTFTVNTNNDTDVDPSNSTTCQDSDGNCSLRAAVEAANNDSPKVDQINVPAGSDIQLTEATAIDITNSVFISEAGGSGAAPIIDGLGATQDFNLDGSTPAVEMTNLTIEHGSTSDSGGDISLGDESGGTADLTLSAVTVTTGSAESGGGIYVGPASALWTDSGTAITNNTTTSGDCGGGISNDDGAIDISGSTISGNSSSDCGGGIYNDGSLVLDSAQINDNSSVAGGAILNDWSLSDTGSSYNGNSAGTSGTPVDGPEGGVLYNDDAASLTNVTVSGTQAWSDSSDDVEGGVFFNSLEMSLTNVSVSNTTNRADGSEIDGGVIANEADACCPSDGTLAVNGLTVTGTSNGAASADTTIAGGVLYNDYKASVSGLNVSSTTNNIGDGELFGGVGDVAFTIDCCPTNFDGSTSYQNVTVSGTTNVGSDDAYEQGGVFDVGFDDFPDSLTPLSGDINGGTITGTTDTLGTNELDGGVVSTESPMSLDNLNIDSTTVNATGAGVFGGAVGSFNIEVETNFETNPSVSANDVSVTNTGVTNVGGGDGYVEGGAWFNSGDMNANGLQVLDTTVTSDDIVFGGALSDDTYFLSGDVNTISNMTNSTFARTNTTMQATGGAIGLFLVEPTNLTNVTVDDNNTVGTPSAGADTIAVGASVGFTNVTVANDTESGGGTNAGISAEAVGHFKNTIVETSGGPNCQGGAFVSDGGNLEAGGNTCNFTAPSDQTNVGNAMVASVANNGGPVQTAALQPGSPAIGEGVSAGCPSTDARGVVRPAGSCDVGAFQLSKQGYWMVASDGGIFSFANAGFYGSMGGTVLNAPIVAMAATPDGKGYWEVAADGGIFNFGDANYYGSMGGKHLNDPIVGMAATPDGGGYWEVASDGGIFSFGDAAFYGSTGSIHLNKPIVGMAAAPSGNGYWLVASDGGIFNYGSGAGFFGSAGSLVLNKPVVGMAAAPNGTGYWLVASDGGIFTYGTGVGFFGSTGSIHLNKPVVGMAATPSGGGYWLFASDGGVFNYGDATFQGSMGGTPLNKPVVGGAANPIE
jgi:CSLREA domain-containing protein